MEIAQFLRGPWLAAIILVPSLVGVAMGLVATPDPRFEASGTFSLVPPTQNELSADTVDPYLDDFRSTLGLKSVLDEVGREVEAADAVLITEPGVVAGGNGTDFRVFAATTDEQLSAEIVRLVTPVAMQRLADKELERALLDLDAQNLAVRTSTAEIVEFETARDVRDVDNEYDRRAADILVLRNTLAGAATEAEQASMQALLDEKTAELEVYAEALIEWRQLDARQNAALDDQAEAQTRYNLVDLWSQDLRVLHETMVVDVEPLSTLIPRMMQIVPVMLLAAAIIFALAWLMHRRTAAVERHIAATDLAPVQRASVVRPPAHIAPAHPRAQVGPAHGVPAHGVAAPGVQGHGVQGHGVQGHGVAGQTVGTHGAIPTVTVPTNRPRQAPVATPTAAATPAWSPDQQRIDPWSGDPARTPTAAPAAASTPAGVPQPTRPDIDPTTPADGTGQQTAALAQTWDAATDEIWAG